jgi:hypothetical protein
LPLVSIISNLFEGKLLILLDLTAGVDSPTITMPLRKDASK